MEVGTKNIALLAGNLAIASGAYLTLYPIGNAINAAISAIFYSAWPPIITVPWAMATISVMVTVFALINLTVQSIIALAKEILGINRGASSINSLIR